VAQYATPVVQLVGRRALVPNPTPQAYEPPLVQVVDPLKGAVADVCSFGVPKELSV